MEHYTKSDTTSYPTLQRIDYAFKSNRPATYGPDGGYTTYVAKPNSEWTNDLSGWKRHEWRKSIALGINASTPLLASTTRVSGSHGSAYAYVVKQVSGSIWYSYEKNVPFGFVMFGKPGAQSSGTLYTKAMNAAKSAMETRVRSLQTAFQGGVYMGELRESLRMFTGGVRGISRDLPKYLSRSERAVRRRLRRLPRRLRLSAANSTLADQWLGYQYGVRPFVRDVQQAAEALARLNADVHMNDHEVIRVTRSAKSSAPYDNGNGSPFWNSCNVTSGGSPTISGRYTLRDDDTTRVTLLAMVKANRLGARGVAQYMGFDTQDWLPTIYEIIPYSFLLDYFTNVNEIVNAYALNRAAIEWCWSTVKTTRMRRIDAFDCSRAGFLAAYSTSAGWKDHKFAVSSPSVKWEVSSISRQNFGSNLVPELEFEIPGVKNWRKWLNMAALARNSKFVSRNLQNLLN